MRRWFPLILAAPLLWASAPRAPAAEPVAATVETTLATADSNIRQLAFDGDPDTYFASEKNPTATDHFTLVFDKPVAVKSVTATTGRPKGGDALEAGTLQLLRGRQDIRGRREVRGRGCEGQAGRPHDPGDPHPAHAGP